MSYVKILTGLDKLRLKSSKIKVKEKKQINKLIDEFYKQNPLKKIQELKKAIDTYGLEWEKNGFIDFYDRYQKKKLTDSNIRDYIKIYNNHKHHIKYKKGFGELLLSLWEGDINNDNFSGNNSV